jgi:hypothetical protein
MACFFTDGLVEARLGDGLLGRERVADIARELGAGARADTLLDHIADRADRAPDDMAACIVRARDDARRGESPTRVEELELDGAPEDEERAKGFLAACEMPAPAAETVLKSARARVAEFGAALLRVTLGTEEGRAEVIPYEPGIKLEATPNGHGNGTGESSPMRSITELSA